MTYTYKYRVDSHGTDINGNAGVTAVMQYIQETANLQHEEYGPTMPQLRAEGKAFVLSRCALDIMLPLRAQDTVSVETWLTEAHGYGFARNSVLYLGDEPAAKMTALWGVIDIPTRKPLRADEIKLGFGTDGRSLEVSSPLRFRIPSEPPLALLGRHKVVYSDCDENLHLNNTRYAAVFCDLLPNMRGKRATGFSINYRVEARLGTEFDVFSSETESGYYFRTVFPDGTVGTEAILTF